MAECRSGWNLFCQEGAPVLLECQRRGVPVQCAGIFRYICECIATTTYVQLHLEYCLARVV
jgi:hypothetical protein